MKVRIQLKQINLLENEEKIIADGNAILENNHLKYKEKESERGGYIKVWNVIAIRRNHPVLNKKL